MISRLSRHVFLLALAAVLVPAAARAVPLLERDVAGSAGGLATGGPFTEDMTLGESAVGVALFTPGPFVEFAGFWQAGNTPVLDAGPRATPAMRAALEILPNPSRGSVSIRCVRPPGAGVVRAAIYDPRGRFVRALGDVAADREGARTFRWDGRDAFGRAAGPGIYFCRIEAGGSQLTRRLALIR